MKRNDYSPGYVYLIYDRKSNLTKIGLSRKPRLRLKYLKETYGNNLEFSQTAWTFNMMWLEKSLHRQFKKHRKYRGNMDGGTEWFALDYKEKYYAKASLYCKALAINASYLLVAIAGITAAIYFATTPIFGEQKSERTNQKTTEQSIF